MCLEKPYYSHSDADEILLLIVVDRRENSSNIMIAFQCMVVSFQLNLPSYSGSHLFCQSCPYSILYSLLFQALITFLKLSTPVLICREEKSSVSFFSIFKCIVVNSKTGHSCSHLSESTLFSLNFKILPSRGKLGYPLITTP